MESGDVLVLIGATLFITFVVGLVLAIKLVGARFKPEGALADALAGPDHQFLLELPASDDALDVYVQYVLEGTRRSGGGIAYGMVLRADIEREASAGSYRELDRGFRQQAEYLCGQAQRPFGEVPLGQSLASGPIVRRGLQIQRGLLLATVPAGGKLTVRGRAVATGATTLSSLLVFVKRAKGRRADRS